MRRTRCAIYTRKSSEEGLEQDFNSLDAQREACEAYVASQRHEGWELVPERFGDGGISGGHLDRPALTRLLHAVEARQIDQIVVYKIDRLTRALADFAKLVERLDAVEASFVSATQSFNTSTSMGRLTLNVLLSFAQFEREVTAERIRDKIAASKKRGLWMGGIPPLGYRPDGRTLAIDPEEAQVVEALYGLYRDLGCLSRVQAEAERRDLRTRPRTGEDGERDGGRPFGRAHIHHILTNPVYAGRIRHKAAVYAGQHPAIIRPDDWDAIQLRLQSDGRKARGAPRRTRPSPLIGKLFDETGDRLTPSHTQKAGKRLRYYVSARLLKPRHAGPRDGWRLPASELERLLVELLSDTLSDPSFGPRSLGAGDVDTMQTASRGSSTGLRRSGPMRPAPSI